MTNLDLRMSNAPLPPIRSPYYLTSRIVVLFELSRTLGPITAAAPRVVRVCLPESPYAVQQRHHRIVP